MNRRVRDRVLIKMKLTYFWWLFCLFSPLTCLALEQHEKLWLGLNKSQNFSENSPCLYLISSELRFIDKNHAWQTGFLEGGLGRNFLFDKSIWLGYRWSGHEFYNQFYQENRLFQQLVWPINPNDRMGFVSRSRLEEIVRGNQSQVALRFRERMALALNYHGFKKINPYFYDEIFFRINRTDYSSNNVLSENRLFIGFNYYLSKAHFLEIGYINQYQYKTPQSLQNQMNHILSLSYNF